MMLLAVMMLTMTAQTAWAGDTPWPDYVTDIILIGGNQNEVNNLETYYENQGYKFAEYEPECRFGGCSHIAEPDCGVKRAVEEGDISGVRYDNYKMIYSDLKGMRTEYVKGGKSRKK